MLNFFYFLYLVLNYRCLGCIEKHDFNLAVEDENSIPQKSKRYKKSPPQAKSTPKIKLCRNCARKYDLERAAICMVFILCLISIYFNSAQTTTVCLAMISFLTTTHYYLYALVFY